jgi:hypothetical protein
MVVYLLHYVVYSFMLYRFRSILIFQKLSSF